MLIEKLPELVRQASEPLANIDTMTVIASDATSALPRQVAGNVAQGLQILKDVVGVDVAELASTWAKKNSSSVSAPV
jgi:flotillin